MEWLNELGRATKAAWGATAFSLDYFPEIAATELARISHYGQINYLEIIEWVECAQEITQQARLDQAFGQPPLTVFWDDRFRVDILFWHTASTGIHQHQFSGAFVPLVGSSIHTSYVFREARQLTSSLKIGTLTLSGVEILEPGSVRKIIHGAGMIHSLFHLAQPSVTLVVRTPDRTEAGHEFEYKPPSLAVQSSEPDALAVKKIQFLGLLRKLKSEEYERLATMGLRHSDLMSVFMILRDARIHFESRNLFDRLVLKAQEYHGAALNDFLDPLEEEWRRSLIVRMRKIVTEPDLRFFLALLLNVPNQNSIQQLISNRYPGRDPLELIDAWLRMLSGKNTGGSLWNEELRVLIRCLLERRSVDDMARILAGTKPWAQADNLKEEISQACARIRASPILKPLFL